MVPFVVLIILDGWGIAPPGPGNAISQAKLGNMTRFWTSFPHTSLIAHGEAVGLPRGEAGNTETGHLNLGAGRIVYQDLLRVNMSIAEGSFFKNRAFLEAIEHAKKNNSNLHLLGLIGSGGVHSNMEHLYALIRVCKDQNFNRVFLHLFTDGRDSPPKAALSYLSQVEQVLKSAGVGKIATVMGRYWAMDRDNRWERTERAYRALTKGEGRKVELFDETQGKQLEHIIQESYEKGITDEFINPIIVNENGLIEENDAVIFYNFRIDRPRQLTRSFVFEDLEKEQSQSLDFDPYAVKYLKTHLSKQPKGQVFQRGEKIKNLFFVTMTKYDDNTPKYARVAYPPINVTLPLGGVLGAHEKRQLKLAESEKERFITYYFNGQQELVFPGEDRHIVPSLQVSTYDKEPEMSARKITEDFLQTLGTKNEAGYSLVAINFANADMVGHTGNLPATVKACEVLDECLGQIVDKVQTLGGVTLITGDHGNAEEMLTLDGKINTEHTLNPVPLLLVGKFFEGNFITLESGILADVAPTILKLLGLTIPSEMTGRSLI